MEFRIALKNPGREKYERKKRFGGRTSKRGKFRHCKSGQWFSDKRAKKSLSREARKILLQRCKAELRQSRGNQQAAFREEAKKYRHFLKSKQPNHRQHWYGFQGEEERAPSMTEEVEQFGEIVDSIAQMVGAVVIGIRASSPRDAPTKERKVDRQSEVKHCIAGLQKQKGRMKDRICDAIHNFVKPWVQDWWDLLKEERWDERSRWDLFEEFPRARDEAAGEVHEHGVLYRRFRGASDFATSIDTFENRLAVRDAMDREIWDYELELARLSRHSSSSSTQSEGSDSDTDATEDTPTVQATRTPTTAFTTVTIIKRVECAFRVNFPHKDANGEPSEEHVNPNTGSGYYHMEWSRVPAADCPLCHGVLTRFFIRSDYVHRQTPVCQHNGSIYRKRA